MVEVKEQLRSRLFYSRFLTRVLFPQPTKPELGDADENVEYQGDDVSESERRILVEQIHGNNLKVFLSPDRPKATSCSPEIE